MIEGRANAERPRPGWRAVFPWRAWKFGPQKLDGRLKLFVALPLLGLVSLPGWEVCGAVPSRAALFFFSGQAFVQSQRRQSKHPAKLLLPLSKASPSAKLPTVVESGRSAALATHSGVPSLEKQTLKS